MPALFRPSANSLYWLAIAAIGGAVVGVPAFLVGWARTPYATGQNEPRAQPVKFDHRHHTHDVGIECLYCHSGATKTSHAGVPATSVCMGCHSQIWTTSPELAAVRASYFEGTPIRWARVNALPDFVFFDHSVHVNHGVACETCHGNVDQMGQVYAARSLTMSFCLDCHRNAPARYGARALTDCTHCHR